MSLRNRPTVVLALLIASAGCGERHEVGGIEIRTPTPGLELQTEDFAVARAGFKTKLVRTGPAPQPAEPLRTPPGAVQNGFASNMKAFVTPDRGDGRKRPAVLFLHGGFGFGDGDWDMARPFRDAGFVVMMPVLRGENGQAGHFTLFYDEVDDVLAAADALAALPYVDAGRLFVAGHSVGGTLAMLAAMSNRRFRAAASLSGSPDLVNYLRGRTGFAPFDTSDVREFRLRSPVAYASSFKCPARLYFGDEEVWAQTSSRRTAALAKQKGLDVEAVEVPGDHFTSVPEAIRRSIAFFQKHS